MYRLIAIDLDGTLLTPQHTITPRTIRTLQRAVDAGLTVVIATGQTRNVLQAVCRDLPLNGPQIIYNGAMIAEIQSRKILHEQLVPAKLILTALNALRELNLYRAYHTYDNVYADKDTPGVKNWYRPPVPAAIEVEDVTTIYPQPCIKLAAIGRSESIRQQRAELETCFAGQLYVTQSSHNLLELLHPEVSKRNALRRIIADLGIAAEEVVAFGDNHNDIGMLQLAGLGIAMENAHEEVKSAAKTVTTSNAEDGVAVAIEHFVLDKGT